MKKTALSILTATLLLFAQGCGNRIWQDTKTATTDTFNYVFDTAPTTQSYHDTGTVPIIDLNYRAADVLYSNVASSELTLDSAVFVSPFTNQNDPGDKSVFGPTMVRQVADRLVQHGVHITEGEPNATDFTYGPGVKAESYTKSAGLLGSAQELPPRSAKLIGSYVITDRNVYMTARLVRLVDSAVVSAHNWTLPITDSVRQMLPQLAAEDKGMVPTVKTSFND